MTSILETAQQVVANDAKVFGRNDAYDQWAYQAQARRHHAPALAAALVEAEEIIRDLRKHLGNADIDGRADAFLSRISKEQDNG